MVISPKFSLDENSFTKISSGLIPADPDEIRHRPAYRLAG